MDGVAHDPPADVLERAGVDPASLEPVEWRHPIWFVRVGVRRAVLHRHPAHRTLADLEAEARLLERIAPHFPVPEPIAMFEADGPTWSLLTHLEGETPGWSPGYDLVGHGAFMAEFHRATADLAVIHGDFTTFNVIARDGRPCGLIDFANAGPGDAIAELGAALWQAGRDRFEATAIDPDRVTAIVSGYHRVSPLPADADLQIPQAMIARGQNLIQRWLDRGEADVSLARERVGVIEASLPAIRAAVGRALG